MKLIRKVSTIDGENFAKKVGIMFFEISAKENINVKKIFFHSITELPIFEQFKQEKGQKELREEFGIIQHNT